MKKDKQQKIIKQITQQTNIVEESKSDNEIIKMRKVNNKWKLLHLKIGNQKEPAKQSEISDWENKIDEFLNINGIEDCLTIVTGHRIEIKIQ